MDFKDLMQALGGGGPKGYRREIKRTPITAMEREAQIQGHEILRKLEREAKRTAREFAKREEAAHDLVWDLVARRHGYANNADAKAQGILFCIEGDDPIDEDDADEREVVVFTTKPEPEPAPDKPAKAPRFVLPN